MVPSPPGIRIAPHRGTFTEGELLWRTARHHSTSTRKAMRRDRPSCNRPSTVGRASSVHICVTTSTSVFVRFCSSNEQDEFVGVGVIVTLWHGETIDRAGDGGRIEVAWAPRENVCRAPHSNSHRVVLCTRGANPICWSDSSVECGDHDRVAGF